MNGHTDTELDPTTRYGLVALAVLQGVALYLLHLALAKETWPATDTRWLKALYTVVIGLPLFFYMGMERLHDKRNIVALVLVPILFWLGWHLGWLRQGADIDLPPHTGFNFAFVFSLCIVLFILAFYFRSWCQNGTLRFDYPRLLSLSWRHALTVGLLGLFVGVFWGLLWLWALLFEVIEISFFGDLFQQPGFAYPITALVGGLGLVLVRNRIRLVATVQYMCEVLIKALLPLAALIVVLFLAALPFTGLQQVWDTGRAAVLIMLLTTILLFFFNAVLSDNPERSPYPSAIHVFVLVGVAVLPLNSFLAAWALWLRIDQYGFTVDRLWAALIQLLVAGYTFSYAALIIWKRRDALRFIQIANKVMALVVAGTLLLAHTPAADFRRWAALSQASRLINGEVEPARFDYQYLRFNLGAYGVNTLHRLRESQFAEQMPLVARRITEVLDQERRSGPKPLVDETDERAVASMYRIIPKGNTLPDSLLDDLSHHSICLSSPEGCLAIRTADNDGDDYWLIIRNNNNMYFNGSAYTKKSGNWVRIGNVSSAGCRQGHTLKIEENEHLDAVPGPFLVFTDGECFYEVNPNSIYLEALLDSGTK